MVLALIWLLDGAPPAQLRLWTPTVVDGFYVESTTPAIAHYVIGGGASA
jgi:hypothetical protein